MDYTPSLLILVAVISCLELCQSLSMVRRCTAPVCARPPPGCRYQPDADECPCNLICNPVNCPTLTCPRSCYNGYIKDENGCNTCNCRPGCYKRSCPADCPFGSYLDRAGCPTCQCKPQPLACHRDVAPLCTKGVCPNACSCQPFCYPSPNDGGSPSGNTVNDFWNFIFTGGQTKRPSSTLSDLPLFLGISRRDSNQIGLF